MYELTVFMALIDFLPVIFFGIGSIYLLRIGYLRLSPGFYTAMAGGAILCFVGGFYKAFSKLLHAIFMYQIDALESIQFILMAPGFFLLFIGAIALLKDRDHYSGKLLSVAPVMLAWKIPFLILMILFNTGFLIVMGAYALKNRLFLVASLYLLSMLTMYGMGYMSTIPSTTTMNWIEQSVNMFVQLSAMTGHILLYYGLLKTNKLAREKVYNV